MSVLDRRVLSDAQRARMAGLISGRPEAPGSTGRDNRMFVEAVLRIVRAGAPWRDLPDVFGPWNTGVPTVQPLERQRRLAPDLCRDER